MPQLVQIAVFKLGQGTAQLGYQRAKKQSQKLGIILDGRKGEDEAVGEV
jgi:hypothetical protein